MHFKIIILIKFQQIISMAVGSTNVLGEGPGGPFSASLNLKLTILGSIFFNLKHILHTFPLRF